MWKVVHLEKYFDFSLYSHHFSLLSLTSLLSAPEREVTSPSDFKVVEALDEYWSSGPRSVNFDQTSKFFSFYFELHVCKNIFKNLIQNSKFKFSFQGLYVYNTSTNLLDNDNVQIVRLILSSWYWCAGMSAEFEKPGF